MLIKLLHHNGSSLLPIDETLLREWKVDRDAVFEVKTEGQRLIIEPVSAERADEQLEKVMDKIERDYDLMFKRLAE
jgi:hypothetical protein